MFLISIGIHLEVQTHHESECGFYQKGSRIKYLAFSLFFVIKEFILIVEMLIKHLYHYLLRSHHTFDNVKL